MKQTTLFVRVGRAEPMPLATVVEDTEQLNAVERAKSSELVAGGVDPSRVQFSRKTTGVVEDSAASTAKKGKGK